MAQAGWWEAGNLLLRYQVGSRDLLHSCTPASVVLHSCLRCYLQAVGKPLQWQRVPLELQ